MHQLPQLALGSSYHIYNVEVWVGRDAGACVVYDRFVIHGTYITRLASADKGFGTDTARFGTKRQASTTKLATENLAILERAGSRSTGKEFVLGHRVG